MRTPGGDASAIVGSRGEGRAPERRAILLLPLLAGTIALGLATRRVPQLFPEVVARFGGDALWAAMVFWAAALWRRRDATRRLAMLALAVAYAVEFSQLYRAPWLDALRATRIGALALGQGFLWSDLASYAVGVALAAGLDTLFMRVASRDRA